MNRAALEHILRAAAAITNERDFIVIGSQAVLGQFPDAPPALLASIEADLYPRDAPHKGDLIDGAIGELSAFHEAFGYYAHGVDESTATLPAGWAERLVPISNENTGGATGWCLEVHDLAAAKLVAGRDRDIAFVRTLVEARMVDPAVLRMRVTALPISDERRAVVEASLRIVERLAGVS
ncbi:MAG TPA: DUF6036 family nucleotidyltransferase [Vicinamibacterales bacterium]|nr:DUF6036 family nucleotidyltransferase [Vicinamibacterales bacterium]